LIIILLFEVGFVNKKDTSESFKDSSIDEVVEKSNSLILGTAVEE